jgi:hypothetical protein
MVEWQPTPIRNRIVVYGETRTALMAVPGSVISRTKVLVDGKEERDLRLFVFWILYQGRAPIVSQNFAQPIKASIPPTRKLLIVQRAADARGPQSFSESEVRLIRRGTRINVEARMIDGQHFEITPVLMNPEDWFAVEFYTASADQTAGSNVKKADEGLYTEVDWTCHVEGVNCPVDGSFFPFEDYTEERSSAILSVSMTHEGWSIYAIIVATVLNVLLLVILAFHAGFGLFSKTAQLWLLAGIVTISMCSGEIVVDSLTDNSIGRFMADQPLYAKALVLVDVASIALLGLKTIIRRRSRKS